MEVRARIYGFVLGGKVIHVRKPLPLGNGPVVCVHPTASEVQIRPVDDRASEEPERIEEPGPKTLYDHLDCYESPSQPQQFSLDLLSVCRQIYHEAVLVPFTGNTFIDDARLDSLGSPHFTGFLDRLVPIQIRSIKHLILNTKFMSYYLASCLNRLSGLRTLKFDLMPNELLCPTAQEFIDCYKDDFNNLLLGSLRLPKLAHIHVRAPDYERRVLAVPLELQRIEEWFRQSVVAPPREPNVATAA